MYLKLYNNSILYYKHTFMDLVAQIFKNITKYYQDNLLVLQEKALLTMPNVADNW